MTKLSWQWDELSPMGGVNAAAMAGIFGGHQLTTEELLVRESVQNSWDAAQENQRLKPKVDFSVIFRFASFSGNAKKHFLDAYRMSDLISLRKKLRANDARAFPSLSFFDEVEKKNSPLPVLYVEDQGTHGLYGDPKFPNDSHFFKALYILGTTTKAMSGQVQGGSFGFGKSAFFNASKLRSLVAHSCFGLRGKDNVTRRALGVTQWAGFEVDGQNYVGRALLGHNEGDLTWPLEDEDADELAGALGMPLRDPNKRSENGTTFLLPMPGVDSKLLQEALGRYWWPALEQGLIDLRVITEDEEDLPIRPRKQAELLPYIRAFHLANGTDPVTSDGTVFVSTWNKFQNKDIGTMALVVAEPTSAASWDEDTAQEEQVPKVALIRGPRMIVKYEKVGRRNLPIRGVYLASKDGDPLLRDVEPPAHDDWDTTPEDRIPTFSTEYAKSVKSRIKSGVREFAETLKPPVDPADRLSLPHLQQALARVFDGRPRAPIATSSPLQISVEKQELIPANEPGMNKAEAVIAISFHPRKGHEPIEVFFACPCRFEEDGRRSKELVDVTITPSGKDNDFANHEDGSWRGLLTPGEKKKFKVVTCDYPQGWTVRLEPRVGPLDRVPS
jgi:hypothetical protein